MANGGKKADIELLFGVMGGGSIAKGSSGAQIKEDLDAIMTEINKKSFEVNVTLSSNSKKLSYWTTALQNRLDELSNSKKFNVKVNHIELGSEARADFKRQIENIIDTINIDKGVNVSVTAKDSSGGDVEYKGSGKKPGGGGNPSNVSGDRYLRLYTQMQAFIKNNANDFGQGKFVELIALLESADKRLEQFFDGTQDLDAALKGLSAAEINKIELALVSARAEVEKFKTPGTLTQKGFDDIFTSAQNKLNMTHLGDDSAAKKELNDVVARLSRVRTMVNEQKAPLFDALQREGFEASRVVDEVRAKISAVNAEQAVNVDRSKFATLGELENLSNWIDKYSVDNKNAIGTAEHNRLVAIKAELDDVIKKAYAAANGANVADDAMTKLSRTRFKDLNSEVKELDKSLDLAGKKGKTMFGHIAAAFEKFGGWTLVTRTLTRIISAFKQLITNVVELDTAMTELYKVTNETDAAYGRFFDKAIERSQKLGATLVDTITATADFARLGYSMWEAADLADAALVYKNVGDGIENISAASESIISTMKAFDVEVKDVMGIVDKFNEVGNNFAISSKGIGDALLNSAAALHAANNTLDESIALITATNNVIQNPEKVGTSLKTVSMFLRAAKTEAEEAGISTDGMAESVSELRSELLSLTGGKVDIQIDEDSFKSTYQIVKELSKVWNELSDISRANILEQLGGKRNSNVVAALITNFDEAEKVLTYAGNASGSALAENERYLDSINGRLDIFQSKFEALSAEIVDSDIIKFVVDFGSALLNVLNILNDLEILLPGIFAGASMFMGKFNLEKMTAISDAILKSRNALNLSAEKVFAGKEIELTPDVKALIDATQRLNTSQKKLVVSNLEVAASNGTLNKKAKENIVSYLGLDKAGKSLTLTNLNLGTSLTGLSGSFKTLWSSMSMFNKLSLIFSILSTLWGWIEKYIDSIETTEEVLARTNEEIKSSTEAVKSLAGAYKDLKKSADEVIPRFAELAKGVSASGKNNNLSTEEYEEFLDLSNKLADMFPELNMGMDSNGNAILNLSYGASNLTDTLYDLVEAERAVANQKIVDEELPKLIKSATEAQEVYLDQIDDYSDKVKSLEGVSAGDSITLTDGNQIALYKDFLDSQNIAYEVINTATGNNVSTTYKILEQDAEKVEQAVADYTAKLDGLSDASQEKINNLWKSAVPAFSAWMQSTSEFDAMGDELQNAVIGVLGDLNFSSLDDSERNNVQKYIQDNILTPISTATPEVQRAVAELYEKTAQFESGDIGFGDYQSIANKVIGELKALKVDNNIINALTLPISTEIDEENVALMAEKIKSILVGRGGVSVDDYVNSMRADEIKVAYSILPENGSITVEEFIGKLEEAKIEAMATTDAFVDVLDFSTMANSLSDVADGVDGITSAMQKLRDGTAMTKAELAQLALEYPKLLEEKNLFNAATIEGQNAVLENALEAAEAEYDGKIEAKIAELEAFNELLQNQIDLEYKKEGILTAISDEAVSDKAANEAWLQEQINAFNANEARNYVQIKDDELAANEELLAYKLTDENSAADGVENIWADTTATLTNFSAQAATAAVQANDESSKEMADESKTLIDYLLDAKDRFLRALAGEDTGTKEYTGRGGSFESRAAKSFQEVIEAAAGNDNNTFTYEDYLIDGKSITEWVDTQAKKSAERRETLRKQIETNLTIIDNLRSLKDLDLTSIYGSGSSSSGTDEEIIDFEKHSKYIKELEKITNYVEDLEKELANTDDPAAKIKIYDKLSDAYREQAAAEKKLAEERSKTIATNAEALRQLGFQVEYNADTNEFYIKNLEHINEIEADSKGNHKDLQTATNELRKETEKLIDTTEDLNDANRDSVDTVEDIVYEIQNAAKEIIACVEEIYEAQIEKYNAIIEKRKESIESIKDELSYEEDLADKIKEIADLQARIDQLSLDDSREAQAERSTLLAELAELQKELSDTQSEHSFEEQTEALDKLAKDYEAEKMAEIELLRESIGTVQDLGTEIDVRIVNAWNNAKKAVEGYNAAVSGLNADVFTAVGVVPKYHDGGVVGSGRSKEEVLALLQEGEVVLNDAKQESVYKMIDFNAELSKRLGVPVNGFAIPDVSANAKAMLSGLTNSLIPVSQNSVFEPHINVTIQHNGNMSNNDALRYGEQIADSAINKMYEAFERRGMGNTRGSRLRQ